MGNGVTVPPSFVSMAVSALSTPITGYTQIFIKHISRSWNPWRA